MAVQYLLLARDDMIYKSIDIEEFPELDIIYMGYRNSLCPSRYNSDIRCFWEGDLEIYLLVNGKLITINDHDKRKLEMNNVDGYIFEGIGVKVINRSRDQTYLEFQIRLNK